MGEIVFDRICKSYGDRTIYHDLCLTLNDNAVTCIVGASGGGKTTLLRMLADLTPYEGVISGQGKCVTVFQESRLIPSLTVERNLAYVCPKGSESVIADMLERVELTAAAQLYPRALSGGMASRVAMARAFLVPADTLLLDEPFRALDVGLKERLLSVFCTLWKQQPRTTVFVTHDVGEAVALAHRILVLDKGRIVREFLNEPTFSLAERDENNYNSILQVMLTL